MKSSSVRSAALPATLCAAGPVSALVAGFALSRQARLEAGVGYCFAGNYIESSLSAPGYGSEDASFIYLQRTMRF